MASKVKKGNYYKKKTQKWFEDRGYTVELTEFVCGRPVSKDKIIYVKKDILASDGIAYNENEFILWNSKYYDEIGTTMQHRANAYLKDYEVVKTPKFIQKQIIIWQPRVKQPTIYI